MKQFLNRVTVTGPDDGTKIDDLIKIKDEFPFVEFAILLSRGKKYYRYPSLEWIKEYSSAAWENQLSTAGHICGQWTRELLLDSNYQEDLKYIIDNFPAYRWQINTHAEPHDHTDDALFNFMLDCNIYGQVAIFQYDNVNTHLLDKVKNHETAIGMKNPEKAFHEFSYATLFDLSHGAGILPEEWPKPIEGVQCGYAGGLSPDNVKDQLDKLETVVGNRYIWIDAETHLRSDHGKTFDIEKVRRFLDNSKDRVADITQVCLP